MNKFIDTIKNAIFEDDPEPKSETHAQLPPQITSGSATIAATPAPAADRESVGHPQISDENELVYKKVLAKTDFEITEVAVTIRKYMDPLSAIPSMDERTKFKTAVVQARAQEGLTQEKILATFDGLKVALRNEQGSFAAAAEATKKQEITNRQNKLREITDMIQQKQEEIAQLQHRVAQISAELIAAQSKIQHAEAQFTLAAQRRGIEIDQEKAKYIGLLQG